MNGNVTRRRMGLLLGAVGVASAQNDRGKPGTTIHQEVDFKATPARIYSALLDAAQFRAFTNAPAEIQSGPGEAFKLFGGEIEGRNIELAPNQRIVQAWRPASWAPGVYSIVRFEFIPLVTGTRIVLDHAGFTEDTWAGLNAGWPEHYWDPLRKYLRA